MPALNLPSSSSVPPSAPTSVPTAGVLRSRALALAACLALVLLGLAWELWLAPTGRGTLAIKVVPLVLALPGLWRLRLYTYRWLSLAVWLYVAEAAVRINTPAGAGTNIGVGCAAAQLALALLLFVACAWHVRQRLAAGVARPT